MPAWPLGIVLIFVPLIANCAAMRFAPVLWIAWRFPVVSIVFGAAMTIVSWVAYVHGQGWVYDVVPLAAGLLSCTCLAGADALDHRGQDDDTGDDDPDDDPDGPPDDPEDHHVDWDEFDRVRHDWDRTLQPA